VHDIPLYLSNMTNHYRKSRRTDEPAQDSPRGTSRQGIDARSLRCFTGTQLQLLTEDQVNFARQWMAERLAERAIEIMKDKNDTNGKKN
jgi:hypothetical protein